MLLCVCFRSKAYHQPRWRNCKGCRCDEGAIYWHFKNKSDLFSEIWELSEASISDLEVEYRAKFPNDPLSVVREILVYILEATVTEERRRLMMEIIFHKCEFVGEMVTVQQAQRAMPGELRPYRADVKRVYCGEDAARQFTHPAGGDFNAQLSFWSDGKLAVCARFVRSAKRSADYVAILLEMYQFCPSLRSSEGAEA
jgi:TetR/AcrR family acrAB operon transcriptional repressor